MKAVLLFFFGLLVSHLFIYISFRQMASDRDPERGRFQREEEARNFPFFSPTLAAAAEKRRTRRSMTRTPRQGSGSGGFGLCLFVCLFVCSFLSADRGGSRQPTSTHPGISVEEKNKD